MENKSINNIKVGASNVSKTTMIKEEKNSKKTGGDFSIPMLIMIWLLGIFMLACAAYYQKKVGGLYFGIFMLIVIVSFYVTMGVLYLYNRNKIKKKIAAMPGVVSRKEVKKMLSDNKYFDWFMGVNFGLFPVFLLLFGALFVVNGSMSQRLSGAGEIISIPYYMVIDFFGMETQNVTYVSESTYIYPSTRGKVVKSTNIYGRSLVNFQTSDGEFITLTVGSDYIEEVRSYNDSEITYIPRTGTYVH